MNAVHTSARRFHDTNWAALAMLFNPLYALQPTPVVALNRAVVTAELDGPEAALATVDALPHLPATTPSTRHAPSSCGAWAGHARRTQHIRRRSSWPATRPKSATAPAVAPN